MKQLSSLVCVAVVWQSIERKIVQILLGCHFVVKCGDIRDGNLLRRRALVLINLGRCIQGSGNNLVLDRHVQGAKKVNRTRRPDAMMCQSRPRECQEQNRSGRRRGGRTKLWCVFRKEKDATSTRLRPRNDGN